VYSRSGFQLQLQKYKTGPNTPSNFDNAFVGSIASVPHTFSVDLEEMHTWLLGEFHQPPL